MAEQPGSGRVPSVSVVIPTYNHRHYVHQTLESVFAQTFGDYEVIVVNDGSPDDTRDVLSPLVEAGRIRYVEQANQGQGAARNRGLAEARGRYVAYLDDDDLWPPDKLAWQVNLLEGDPSAVLAYGDYARIEPDGRLGPPVQTHCPSGEVRTEFLRGCWLTSPGQALIHADALRRIGGFDPAIWGSDDWDLYIRLSALGPFLHARRVALHYRVHASNASKQAVRHAQNHMKVVRKHMGWNVPRIVRSQRESARYFVHRLLPYAHQARRQANFADARRAYLYALSFRPSLLLDRSFAAGLVGTLLRRRPSGQG